MHSHAFSDIHNNYEMKSPYGVFFIGISQELFAPQVYLAHSWLVQQRVVETGLWQLFHLYTKHYEDNVK